jgi:hypothetical protein
MMALARVATEHQHAVQRELLCERYSFAGFGRSTDDELSLNEFISFVLGAPPESALGRAVSEGWTKIEHLLASMMEQQANLIGLTDRFERPGVKKSAASDNPGSGEPKDNRPPLWGGSTDKSQSSDGPQLDAQQIQNAVALGGKFDRFDTPEEFEAMRAKYFPNGVYGARQEQK